MLKITIYLSGRIPKGIDDIQKYIWGNDEKTQLKQSIINAVSPIEFIYLDPRERTDDISNTLSVFGKDLLMVLISDIIVADGRTQLGLGSGAEMMLGQMIKTPVLTVIPEPSHYHKKDIIMFGKIVPTYKHPFAYGLSNHTFQEITQAGEWIANNFTIIEQQKLDTLKNLNIPDEFLTAINEYLITEFYNDQPFHSIISNNEHLNNRVERIKLLINEKICDINYSQNNILSYG